MLKKISSKMRLNNFKFNRNSFGIKYFSENKNQISSTEDDYVFEISETPEIVKSSFKEDVTFYVSDYNYNTYSISSKEGYNLFDVLNRNGIRVNTECNKNLQCGQCHCILEDEIINDKNYIHPNSNEEDMCSILSPYTNNSRFSCQVTISKAMEGRKLYLLKNI